VSALQLGALLGHLERWGIPNDGGRNMVPGLHDALGNLELFQPTHVILHHTGSGMPGDGPAPNAGVVRRGRTGLRGPLCHLLVTRDRRVQVISLGKANHAGDGGPWRGLPAGRGNTHALGIEIEHNGTDREPWTGTYVHFCYLVAAAMVEMLGAGAGNVLAHKEWAPDRKIDPYRWDMDTARAGIAAILKAGPAPKTTTTPEDDDMKANDPIPVGTGSAISLGLAKGDTEITYGEAQVTQAAAAKASEGLLRELLAEIKGLRADLASKE
jgi:hypothetical protein